MTATVASAAAAVGLEVAPGAGGDQPPARRRGPGAWRGRRTRRACRRSAPEEQVGAVLGHPAVGIERPDARVGGVEEAGPRVGGGEQQPVAVADRRAVGLGDQPDVAQSELSERAGAHVGHRALGLHAQARRRSPRRGCPAARSGRSARAPASGRARASSPVRWVPVRVRASASGRRVEPAEPPAAVVGGAPAGVDAQVEDAVGEADLERRAQRCSATRRCPVRSSRATAAAYGAGWGSVPLARAAAVTE